MRFFRVWGALLAAICLVALAACGDSGSAATPTPVAQPTTAQPNGQQAGQPTAQSQGGAATTPSANSDQQGGGTGISGAEAKQELIVFAASSLKDAFEGMSAAVQAKGIGKPSYNFAGSQALLAQLQQGAVADVFASADEKTMLAAIDAGVVPSGTQRLLATNKLVVIVPPGAGPKVASLNDLVKPGTKIVLADPSVPAGNYTSKLLDKMSADKAYGADFKDRVLANVVSKENNVRQVLTKVQLGEADAGVVYVTDARAPGASGSGKVGTLDIPDEYNVVAQYYIAPVIAPPHATASLRFIKYTRAEDGQKALESFGFGRGVKSK